eukprot:Opistho-2@90512
MELTDPDRSFNFKGMAVFAVFASTILFSFATVFFYFALRGTGFKQRRSLQNKRKAPEENMLSGMATCITGVVWFSRAVVFISLANKQEVSFNIENYKYFDYLISCPMLVLDICFVAEEPYKWTFTLLTALTLFIGALSVSSGGSDTRGESFAYFGLGSVFFTLLFYWLFRNLFRRLNQYPKDIRIYLRLAVYTFLVVWPFFPILYLIGPLVWGFMSVETDTYLHGLLDICAKGLYGAFLLRFRLCLEDIENNALAASELMPVTGVGIVGDGEGGMMRMTAPLARSGSNFDATNSNNKRNSSKSVHAVDSFLQVPQLQELTGVVPVTIENDDTITIPTVRSHCLDGAGRSDTGAFLDEAQLQQLHRSRLAVASGVSFASTFVPSHRAESTTQQQQQQRRYIYQQQQQGGAYAPHRQRAPLPMTTSPEDVRLMLRNFSSLINGMLEGFDNSQQYISGEAEPQIRSDCASEDAVDSMWNTGGN